MTVSESAGERKFPPWMIPAIGYAVSLASLVWVYRGTNWQEEWVLIRGTEWYWVLAAVVSDVAVYAVQGWRWNILLKPVGAVPVGKTIQAIYIGLFANECLPFRPGEILRCYLQSRWSGVSFPIVLSSMVLERLFDGVWLILGFLMISMFVHVPRAFLLGSLILATFMVIVSVMMFLAMARKRDNRPERQGRMAGWIQHLANGLEAMGNSPSFYWSMLLSLLYLALQVGPIYFLMCGYFDTTSMIGIACVVLVLLRLGSILPQGPGNVGSFQALVVLGLHLFGVHKAAATGFATMLFVVVTVPLWLVGLFALLGTRMRLDDLRRDAHEVHRPGRV